MDGTREGPRVDVDRPRCPFCHEDVGADDDKTACEGCMAWHHRACWADHGSCSACGRAAATTPIVVEARPESRPAAPPSRCARFGCTAEAAPGQPICDRHRVQDYRVNLVIGTLALVAGVVLLALDVVQPVGVIFGILGALNLGIGFKSWADRANAPRVSPPRPEK